LPVALALALTGVSVLCYAPVRHFSFVSIDDPIYVLENPLLGAGFAWSVLRQVFTSTYANFWHPLTLLSLMLDVRLFGTAAGPMHVTALLLHISSTLLLFLVLVRATRRAWPSALAAALFAVHPLHVESVAWISQRKDVLSTVFWMATLLAYVAYARSPNWRRYALILACFTLGLMAKPMLVTLPFVLLLLDWWPLGRLNPQNINPQNTQNTQNINPQNTQSTQTINPQNTRNTQNINPQNTQNTQSINPQNTQNTQSINPQNTQSTQNVNPQNTQSTQNVNPQNTQSTQNVNPQNTQKVHPQSTQRSSSAERTERGRLTPACPERSRRACPERSRRTAHRLPHASDAQNTRSMKKLRAQSASGAEHEHRRFRSTNAVRSFLPLLVEKLPLFGLSVVASVVAVLAQQRGGAVATLEGFPLASRLTNAPVACVMYLWKMVWPRVLTVFYPYAQSPQVGEAVVAALALAAVTAVVVRLVPRRPYLAVGWFWYLVTLAPVSGLVQVGSHAMADRYTYVPLVGLFIAFAWSVADLAGPAVAPGSRQGRLAQSARRVLVPSVACAVVLASALVTRAQVMTWKDSRALWQHALDVMPDNYFAHNAIGLELQRQGRTADAAVHFERSSELAPGFPNGENNLGLLLAGQGKTAEAIAHYMEALRRAPGYRQARVNLGNALVQAGRADDAIPKYEEVLRTEPGAADVRTSLAGALSAAGRHIGAVAQYEQALRLDPASATTHFNYANELRGLNRLRDSVEQYREALRLDPGFADAHENLAIVLERLGGGEQAIAEFEEALRLSRGSASARTNLGNGLLNAGRVQEAIEQFRAALRSEPGYAAAHIGLGTALFRNGRIEEALAEHRMAVRLAPALGDAHYNLATTLQAVGRLAESVAEYRETLRVEGGSLDVYLALGGALERLGRFREANAEYREVLRLAPGLPAAVEGLARGAGH
jgi:tetratricopeptide (TPR) repeat protein